MDDRDISIRQIAQTLRTIADEIDARQMNLSLTDYFFIFISYFSFK